MERLIKEYRRRWLEACDAVFTRAAGGDAVSEERWIPVSERLPPAFCPVLVWGSWSGQWRTALTRQNAYVDENGHWQITGRAYDWPFRVTHWMLLSPPQEVTP